MEAVPLAENAGIVFLGMMKGGPFDIDGTSARHLLAEPINRNGRPNSDVVKRRLGGQEVTGRERDGWIIDFGVGMTEDESALYEKPFEYVKRHVKPLRNTNNRERMKRLWWLHGEARPGLRRALAGKTRCIVTPEVAKYRLFVWMPTDTVPDHKLHVFARDDDYFFGVLHSRLHEIWSLALGSTLEDRPSYASSATFGTFPMPWPPGTEPNENDSLKVRAIADAARALVSARETWLNPLGALPADLQKRTLTNLYNARPDWLASAHADLDAAVFAAYGWASDLSDADVLFHLLALNGERFRAN